ncbi:unnamed protein product [Rhizoctonia solani]|uniref:Uncharacterized protein n=1 Tax=Rhizoctonia solani TaxID=456999 RepID=A0A8H3CUM7_9AGAM|nr:unnamed protein product [Rhizoctonia solani]
MLQDGPHIITTITGLNLFIPLGARAGSPVQAMHGPQPSPILVKNLGGDKYSLTPMDSTDMPGHLVLGAHRDAMPHMVVLIPSGTEEYTEWAIDQNGPNQYTIHPTSGPGNEYWTAQEGSPIELKEAQGLPTQSWNINPLLMD